MKKIKTAIMVIGLLGAGIAFGAIAKYDFTPTKSNTVLNNQYFDENNYNVYRFQDTVGNVTNTCYTVEYEVYRGVNNQRGISISCTK